MKRWRGGEEWGAVNAWVRVAVEAAVDEQFVSVHLPPKNEKEKECQRLFFNSGELVL